MKEETLFACKRLGVLVKIFELLQDLFGSHGSTLHIVTDLRMDGRGVALIERRRERKGRNLTKRVD
ncbi:hypothetical protein C1H46_008609 [Malus baccata]|uniref:Uncharacterized protein n=1 Tax=Malus baccata TaxID=106549 RepID=A0A540N5L2_MALBA|nr:hypothetical protein C1H46_008609 [Malus baccata]